MLDTYAIYNSLMHPAKELMRTVQALAAMLLLAGCAACTSDADEPTYPDPEPISIGMGNTLDFSVGRMSRDGGEPADITDEQSATTFMPDHIGVLATTEVAGLPVLFSNKDFYYIKGDTYADMVAAGTDWEWPTDFVWPATNDWPYKHIEYWDGTWKNADESTRKRYQFYAYAPYSSFANTTVNMETMALDNMSTFTLGKIPPFSSINYMIARKVVETRSGTMPVFDMRNLSARICMRLKIGDRYNRIRKIRIREITINDREENSATYYKCQYAINADQLTFSADGLYVPSQVNSTIPVIPIFKDEYGLLLTTTFQQFGSLYCMPQDLQNITMNVTYDVYDNEPDVRDPLTGLLLNKPIRTMQKATNNVTIGVNVESGKYYNINIVVSPDFLYVLSDNDVVPDLVITPEQP